MGPHKVVQNVAARMIDRVDRPVLLPYSKGSTMLLLINSNTRIKPKVHNTMFHEGSTAKANNSGKIDDNIGPTYGTKRITTATMPHKMAAGTPISHKPKAMGTP